MWDRWSILLIILIVEAAVIAYTRVRRGRAAGPESAGPSRNYTDERESDRVCGMSAEDREWEAASIQRNRDAKERDTAPPARR